MSKHDPSQPDDGGRTPDAGRKLLIGVSITLGLVILAPVLLSSTDLYGWGRTGLGLPRELAWLVPVALDCAAASCIGMTVLAAWRRERPGVFELLVWVFAGTSAWAQYHHGIAPAVRATAPDAYWAYPAFALLGPVLLHVTLSRVRRWARQDTGQIMHGAAGFGSRWLPGVALRETLAAWAASRREGIDGAADSVAYVREVAALRGLAGADALRYAWQALGHRDPYPARVWLQARHVMVTQTDVDAALAAEAVASVVVPSMPARRQLAAAPVSPAPAALVPPTPRAALVARPPTAADLGGDDYHRAQLAGLATSRDQVRYAFRVLGSTDVPAARAWLAALGIEVSKSNAHDVRRALLGASGEFPTVPAPAALAGRVNGHQH